MKRRAQCSKAPRVQKRARLLHRVVISWRGFQAYRIVATDCGVRFSSRPCIHFELAEGQDRMGVPRWISIAASNQEDFMRSLGRELLRRRIRRHG